MQWTVLLEAKSSAGEVKTTELVTFSRPVIINTLAEIGLVLDETKTLLARLHAGMLCGQVAEYAALCRVCDRCLVIASIFREPSKGGQSKSPNLPAARGALQHGVKAV